MNADESLKFKQEFLNIKRPVYRGAYSGKSIFLARKSL